MHENLKFDPMAIAMEMIPAAIQAAGIAAFLLLTAQDTFETFVAITLCVIWLKVSENKMAEQFGEFRVKRHLFSALGKWLDKGEAADIFDSALEKYLMFEGNVESDQYKAVVTAAGLANNFRGLVSFVVYSYLFYAVGTLLLEI